MISLLVSQDAGLEQQDRHSKTPLLVAAHRGQAEAVERLLTLGARADVLDKEDRSAMYWAADQNNMRSLSLLLANKGAALLLSTNDRWDNTPLHTASAKGHLEAVVALIEAGAQIDNKNEDEQTPLHVAAKNGKTR